MPTIQNGEATLYYEVFGPANGFPILTFAPGGLLSAISIWKRPAAPLDPTVEFADEYRVIAMDQRNAPGQSRAPITGVTGWDSFTSDHVAVLDHLGIQQCHLYGQCIGGPFIFNMLKQQPQRIVAAVIAQPIGRVGELQPGRSGAFDGWAKTLENHPEATDAVLDAMFLKMYGPGFAYSVDRDFVRNCQTPALVLAGNDAAHPFAIAKEIAQLLPHAEFIPEWKEGAALVAAKARMKSFLSEHTPVRA
jgi:pimeloyl-ACP methyl ester carboxylesterase